MTPRAKLVTSLILFNTAVLVAVCGFFETDRSYSWSNTLQWSIVSRDWKSIAVVLCVSCLVTRSFYLMLDSFGKLPNDGRKM